MNLKIQPITKVSECVSYGHPDKIADQISDLILDYYIQSYNKPKVAVEVLIARYTIIIAGEVSENIDKIKISKLVKDWIIESNVASYLTKEIDRVEIIFLLDQQSKEISNLVNIDNEKIGAGDQGMMYGYATSETENFMPAPIFYARKILNRIFEDIKNHPTNKNLGPDAKSQIAIQYDEKGNPIHIKKILISIQHEENLKYQDVKNIILPSIVSVIPNNLINEYTEIMVNPAGSFVVGGPFADTGLTGRKIIVDTYGGLAPHGGGAFSGKDPTKVDRSAAYMTRYIAKNIVAAKIAQKATVNLAYTIGMIEPFSFSINTHGTGIISDQDISLIISSILDLSPNGIIEYLKLWQPIYYQTAKNGHFGNINLPWEKLNLIEKLKNLISNNHITFNESNLINNNLYNFNE
jgi:S-adenosylmethionine synthetase